MRQNWQSLYIGAYEYFRKLQFKNLLAKFEAEVPVNEVEKHFLERGSKMCLKKANEQNGSAFLLRKMKNILYRSLQTWVAIVQLQLH